MIPEEQQHPFIVRERERCFDWALNPGAFDVGAFHIVKPRDPGERVRFKHKWKTTSERDEADKALGDLGEKLVIDTERAKLKRARRPDLAARVIHIASDDDYAGYDVLSFKPDGSELWIEVKTTRDGFDTPFYLSGAQKMKSEEAPDKFRIYRVYDVQSGQPKIMAISPPLPKHLALTIIKYSATVLSTTG